MLARWCVGLMQHLDVAKVQGLRSLHSLSVHAAVLTSTSRAAAESSPEQDDKHDAGDREAGGLTPADASAGPREEEEERRHGLRIEENVSLVIERERGSGGERERLNRGKRSWE
jgi:hypothetical protein